MAQIESTVIIDCVGCHHRPENCKKMMDDPEWSDHMSLVDDPTNEYDPKAIAIKYKDVLVGYVPRHKQAEVRHLVGKTMKWAISGTKFIDTARTLLKWVEFQVEC